MTDAGEIPKPSEVVASRAIEDAMKPLSSVERSNLVADLMLRHVSDLDEESISKIRESLGQEEKRRSEATLGKDAKRTHVADMTDNLVESRATVESPVQRAERLAQHIIKAEFNSFQEYDIFASKTENGFKVVTGFDVLQIRTSKDDIILATNADGHGARGTSIMNAIEKYFRQRIRDQELFCIAGELEGKFIIQGAGIIHSDTALRDNPSAFKVVFDDQSSQQEYLKWIESSPNEAMKQALERVMSRYNSDGRPVGTYIPGSPNSLGDIKDRNGTFSNPFAIPIRQVKVRNVGKIDQRINPHAAK